MGNGFWRSLSSALACPNQLNVCHIPVCMCKLSRYDLPLSVETLCFAGPTAGDGLLVSMHFYQASRPHGPSVACFCFSGSASDEWFR